MWPAPAPRPQPSRGWLRGGLNNILSWALFCRNAVVLPASGHPACASPPAVDPFGTTASHGQSELTAARSGGPIWHHG